MKAAQNQSSIFNDECIIIHETIIKSSKFKSLNHLPNVIFIFLIDMRKINKYLIKKYYYYIIRYACLIFLIINIINTLYLIENYIS